jgi:ATP-dependent Clp endopeptidase proteolytic subunit ClpP
MHACIVCLAVCCNAGTEVLVAVAQDSIVTCTPAHHSFSFVSHVAVFCISRVAAVLAQGKRYSLPNSRIMIHQPLGGAQGQATDIEIQANEILHHKLTLNGYLVRGVLRLLLGVQQQLQLQLALAAVSVSNSGINGVGGHGVCNHCIVAANDLISTHALVPVASRKG